MAKPPLFELNQKALAFASAFWWYARLDSNQRPLESELSGRKIENT